MTDRELHTPSPVSPASRPPAPGSAPTDPAHEGNGSLMTATIATRTPVRTPSADPSNRGRVWLARLFAGDFSFPTIPTGTLPSGERTAAEYDAIDRALGCRDLFVIHADLVAGERVIADLARSAPDRVLVLSPDPAAADRVTERLLKCGVPVLRALADDENPTRPSPAVSKATTAALGGAQLAQAKHAAAAAVTAAEQRIEKFAVVAKAVARLIEVNALLKKLDDDLAELNARHQQIEAEVANEAAGPSATAFAEQIKQRQIDFDAHRAEWTAASTTAQKVAAEKGAEVHALRQQHASATHKSGFFTRLFGKAKPAVDADELKKHLEAAEAELAALAAAATARQAEVDARTAASLAERQKLLADEVAARRAASEAKRAAAETERDRARAEGAALSKVISAAVPDDDHATAERELAAARERAAEVARSGPEALARAAAETRAVVGTPGCLAVDPLFAALTDDPPFGLLVLDRAEELPETEFPRLARLAERWVLVGAAVTRDDPRPPLNGSTRAPRNGRPIEVPFVARVAKLLDRETWAAEGDRLVCRLVHLTPEQRRHITREPLADRPEIELRFTASDAEPLLAEIAFPGTTALPAAKSFLFHALGEVLLRPCGDFAWAHEPGAITAIWPAADSARDAAWIDLEPGVREKVTGAGLFAYTAAVSFDLSAGWDAEKAAEWLGQYLPPPAISRFAAVPRASGSRS